MRVGNRKSQGAAGMSTEQAGAGVSTGGCQCGAVRYRITGPLASPHLCHCRMCQKAAGNYFMPLASAAHTAFRLTRGTPAWFQSSRPVRRGFCRDCGTPLFFETVGGGSIAVTLGSLDDPSAVPPITQDGVEGRVDFVVALGGLPERDSARDDLPGGLAAIVSTNRQHPDHDT
jgi:hypothetical protein